MLADLECNDSYLKTMQAYNIQNDYLKLLSNNLTAEIKQLKTFEKKTKKQILVEFHFRKECMEYLYSLSYPCIQMAKAQGSKSATMAYEIPSIEVKKAKTLGDKNKNIEKAIDAISAMTTLKKINDVDPKRPHMIGRR